MKSRINTLHLPEESLRMLEAFKRYISENSLCSTEHRVLLAVSGGIDSMVMTDLFDRSGIPIAIAHCNFRLRGSESDGDERFVKKAAARLGVPFHSVRFRTEEYAEKNGISVQMAARELRYKWFEEIRKSNNCHLIAVAHNLDDNVETLLINLSRGTGIAGLTGMKARSGFVIRPLLFATREEIAEYSKSEKIRFREDSSNADVKYTRNLIRHKIIPHFIKINPSFRRTLYETTEKLSQVNEIFALYISDLRKRIVHRNKNHLRIRISDLVSLSPKDTLLFELFRPFGMSPGQVEALQNLINGKTGGRLNTGEFRIIRDRKHILVLACTEPAGTHILIESFGQFGNAAGILKAEMVRVNDKFKIPASPGTACIDAATISYPLIIRNWKRGDSFFPLGMNTSKKLSDYFIDNKYSLPEKESALILESGGKIAWLIGDRIDNRFRITASTRQALVLRLRKRDQAG